MLWYSELVVVNHGVLYGASGFESSCAILNQWLVIMVCNAAQVIVKYGELCCASGC
jgi:hypothetical protein